MPMVDVIFADVAQPDQARILGLNAAMFVKNRGHFVISIKASCVDSTKPPEVVYASEIEELKKEKFRPVERISLEPYERDHIVVCGMYRPAPEDFPHYFWRDILNEKRKMSDDNIIKKKIKKIF